MEDNELKTLKDIITTENVEVKKGYSLIRCKIAFLDDIKTELGLKRIVKLEREKEYVNPLGQSLKDVKIEELMEVFNISWRDIKKFKEESK